MYVAEKKHLHPRSFRHRIRDGAVGYFDSGHFLGLDPLDHCRFQDLYQGKRHTKRRMVLEAEDTNHLISNW